MSDLKQRARAMVAAMSLSEKVSQMVHEARGISRLSIPPYNWWNEALHGVGRAGIATVFPQAIGMAAMFDDVFLKDIATVISDEVRAKYNEALREDQKLRQTPPEELAEPLDDDYFTKKNWYRGITCWSPNINIFRDPRWGRGHETYGEDPYLTSRLGVAFVQGLQGDDPHYLKTVATPKHFAVHSGPEGKRHGFNVEISRKDLYETYLPAFKACVVEGKAFSVMSAYNAVYGVPCSASRFLLEDILRQEWGFEGFVVSDCGAVNDIFANHHYAKSQTEAAAMAVNAGCDLNCGAVFNFLDNAVEKGLISEETLDRSVERLFEARIRLGMFDDAEAVPYNAIDTVVIDCPEHRALALEASRRCMVLLKNDGMLPFHNSLKKLAVIGPNADSEIVLLGNYNGTPSSSTTMLAGIQERFSGETVAAKGCELTGNDRSGFAAAVQAAQDADAVVLCLGLSPELEGEEGDAYNADASGDRLSLKLPGLQEALLSALAATSKPIAVVLLSGSALDLRQVAQQSNAVIQAWYPG